MGLGRASGPGRRPAHSGCLTTEILTEVALFQVGQSVGITNVLRSGAPGKKISAGWKVTSVRYDGTYGFVYGLSGSHAKGEVLQRYLRKA